MLGYVILIQVIPLSHLEKMTTSSERTQRAWDGHIEHFLRHDTGFLNGNHELSWQPLRQFLSPVRDSNPYEHIAHFPKNDCRILYDSIGRDNVRERRVLTDKQLFQLVRSPHRPAQPCSS